jgi:hypothetical protein
MAMHDQSCPHGARQAIQFGKPLRMAGRRVMHHQDVGALCRQRGDVFRPDRAAAERMRQRLQMLWPPG